MTTASRSRMTIAWQIARLAGNTLFLVLARRALSLAHFGYLTTAFSFGVVVLFLVTGGLDRLVAREAARNAASGAALLVRSVVYQLFLFAAVAAAVPYIARILHLKPTETALFYIVGAASLLMGVTFTLCGFQVGIDRFKNIVLTFVPTNIILLAGAFVLFIFRAPVVAWGLLWLFSRFLMFGAALFLFLRTRNKPVTIRTGRFLIMALPMGLFYLSSVLLLQVDTLALRRAVGASTVGLYQEAFRLVIAGTFLLRPIELPFFPTLSVMDPRSLTYRRDWSNMTTLMLFVATSVGAGLIAFRKPLLWLAFGHTDAAFVVVALVGFLLMRSVCDCFAQFFIINGPLLLGAGVMFAGVAFSWFLTIRYASVLGPMAGAFASFLSHTMVATALAVSVLLIFRQHPFGVRLLPAIAPAGGYIAASNLMPQWLQILLLPFALFASFILLPSHGRRMLLEVVFIRRKRFAAGERAADTV
ncbi:MAG: hypothetical protein DRP82_03740 [Planctomycetota bacterium]|nr:MAG: hypothetical protein DRP82_03740 [Planctomycetota bacterium]